MFFSLFSHLGSKSVQNICFKEKYDLPCQTLLHNIQLLDLSYVVDLADNIILS